MQSRGFTTLVSSLSAASIALAFAMAAVPAGCRLAEKKMADRTPMGCAQCHADITRQWQCSAHAEAWTDPEYLKATQDHHFDHCLSCHASTPLLEQPSSAPPQLRDYHRQHGVDCNVCHKTRCAYAGPYKSLVGPHDVKQDRTRLPGSSFCGTCHEMEYEEYTSLYVPSVESCKPRECAECHMPMDRSRLTQGHVLSLIHPKRIVHDHSFPTWSRAVSKGAVEISSPVVTRPASGQLRVVFTLTNRGAGHGIPTGNYGHRELRILVQMLGPQGDVVAESEQSIRSREQKGLAPGQPVDFSFELDVPDSQPAPPATVRVLVERVNQDRSFHYTFIDNQWPLR